MYRIFALSEEGSNEGQHEDAEGPEGCLHTRCENPISTSTDESIGITFLRMENYLMGWLHLYKTPLGMICL